MQFTKTPPAGSSDPHEDRTLPMTVNNMGFLLDRLGQDCAPLQFIRELTVNAIEAIQALPDKTGEIYWDYDKTRLDLEQVYKLCIIDTGIGMSGPELESYINKLSSSGRVQAIEGNYGMGAKIAAATKNPLGVIYLSWKNGAGSMIQLWKNPATGQYGLKQLELPGNRYGHWGPVEDLAKPPVIGEHGTMVILLGEMELQNTMESPPGIPSPSRWIARYLNSRFFHFPKGVSLRAREGWTSESKDTNVLRLISGAAEFLDRHKECSGRVDLGDAMACWWILKEANAISQSSGANLPGGHIAALYHDELYELSTSRSGVSKLQSFGVSLGHQRVVIYVEPRESQTKRITTNTARTQLLADNEPLPWADWAERFRANFPDEIRDLMDSVSRDRQETDYAKSIRERLKDIEDLLKLKKYRPSPEGAYQIGSDFSLGNPRPVGRENGSGSGSSSSGRGGLRDGDLYTLFLKEANGIPGTPVSDRLSEINVQWVRESEVGIADRAATYIQETNTLLINEDFRVFTDFIMRWEKQYKNVPGARNIIIEVVHEWFQQTLVELIYSVDFLRGGKQWSESEITNVISPEALTAAILPRYHTEMAVRRALGQKLGSARDRPL